MRRNPTPRPCPPGVPRLPARRNRHDRPRKRHCPGGACCRCSTRSSSASTSSVSPSTSPSSTATCSPEVNPAAANPACSTPSPPTPPCPPTPGSCCSTASSSNSARGTDVADAFVGTDIDHAIAVLRRLQVVMDNRYAWLRAHRRRKIARDDGLSVITVAHRRNRLLLRHRPAPSRNRKSSPPSSATSSPGAAPPASPVVAATQRPSFDIIPTSLRDLFGYRAAFRCTTPTAPTSSSAHGWAEQGYSATDISPATRRRLLLAEGGIPHRIKVAYLSDTDIRASPTTPPGSAAPTGSPPPPPQARAAAVA